MKQTAFVLAVTLLGTVGAVVWDPVYSVIVYYFFAVLRPQFIWQWALPVGYGWSSYVAYTAIACLVMQKLGGVPGVRLTAAHRAVLAFGAWVSVTYFTATNQNVAFPFFVEYLKIFLMYYVASQMLRTVGHLWAVFLMTGATLGYIAVEINDVYFRQGGFMYIYRLGYGGLDNNGAGLMLAMGVPLCYFAWEGMRSRWRWAFLGLIPLLLHAVLMSFSRGAMVSLIPGVLIWLVRSKHKAKVAVVLLAVACMIPFLAGKEIRERFFSISRHDMDASANARKTTWGIAWKMACERPVFGFGIRNSNLYTYAYGADTYGRTIHSQYLQTAADSGLVALGLYLGALGLTFRATRRVIRDTKRRTDPEGERAHAVAAGVEGAMIVFAVGGAFLSLENFELPYIAMLLGAQLVAVCGPAPEDSTEVGAAAAEPGPYALAAAPPGPGAQGVTLP